MEKTLDSVNRVPVVISGFGVLLGGVLVGELLTVGMTSLPAPAGFRNGVLTSLPFVAGQIYGGYWLARSDLTPDRYGHIGRWWTGVTAVSVLMMTSLNASFRPTTVLLLISTVRWGAAIGGGAGVVMGIQQARAVQRAVETEQARRRHEEAERERDRLEEFASIVSHDLRSPLNVAQGTLELLREDCDSPYIDEIESSHDRMAHIIDDTLALARAGENVGETTTIELSVLVGECWGMVETEGATLDVEGSMTVEADESRLRQLFENLFRNAVEHGSTENQASPDETSQQGSADDRTSSDDAVEEDDSDVTVRVGTRDDGTGFYVADNGPGIPESDRETVFESGYSGSDRGTGFGLSIVETIADAHGWEITVTESESGGARFDVTGIDQSA